MNTRCKGCNRKMFDTEIKASKSDGTPEDLCNICISSSYDDYDIVKDKEYVHGDLEDGLRHFFTDYSE